MNAEYKPGRTLTKDQKIKTAADVMSSIPLGVNIVGQAMKRTDIDDPNRYYNSKTKAKLESYNKKIKAAKTTSAGFTTAATGLGTAAGALALTGVGLPLAAILGIAGGVAGIGAGISEGVASSYGTSQGKYAADYDQLVADRQKTERRAKAQREKNEEINQQQYFQQAPSPNAGISMSRDGGMMKYQVGGLKREAPLEEEVDVMDPAMDVLMNGGIRKYMGGGYTKVNGPSHEDGGVPMDLDGDGVVESELEGGEGVEDMKTGGKYIWSDHLKTGGMSFAKKFEQERKRGATPRRIEKLRVEQELAAKRDPSKLYEKYGGMMKYGYGGKMEYQKGGNKKEVLSSDISKVLQNDDLNPDFIRRPLSIDKSKVWQNDTLSPDFIKRPKEVLSSDISEVWQNDTLSPDFISRPKEIFSSDISKVWQDDDLSPDFINKKKQARVYADMLRKRNPPLKKYQKDGLNQYRSGGKLPKEVLESKRDGGLMKYREGGPKGFSMIQPEGTFDDPVPQKQKFVSPFGTLPEEKAFQDYANAQEAGVTNGYGWGSRSAAAYDKYGDQYDFDSAEARIRAKRGYNDIKNNSSLPRNEAWAYEVARGDESATRPPQAFLNEQYAKNQKLKTRQQTLKNLKGGFNEYAGGAAALLGAGARAAALGSIDPNERPPSMSARDVKAAEVSIDRARVNRGVIESELINAKRGINMTTGPKTAALNSARMVSLRALEEAEMDAYEQNRLASAQEQLANQKAQLEAYGLNQGKDLKTSESISRIMDKVIDTRKNQTIAGGEIAAQSMKYFQSWKANQDLARAMEGDRNVMSNFYNNNYPAFARKFKKGNPNATALEINQAFLASV